MLQGALCLDHCAASAKNGHRIGKRQTKFNRALRPYLPHIELCPTVLDLALDVWETT